MADVLRAWHEPSPRPRTVALLGAGLGLGLMLAVTSAAVANWDLAVLTAVVSGALAVDLWRGLRGRDFVVAGPDALVARTRGRTASWPWGAVAGVEERRRRWRSPRPVLRLRDGSEAALPLDAPVPDLRRWVAEQGRPGGDEE